MLELTNSVNSCCSLGRLLWKLNWPIRAIAFGLYSWVAMYFAFSGTNFNSNKLVSLPRYTDTVNDFSLRLNLGSFLFLPATFLTFNTLALWFASDSFSSSLLPLFTSYIALLSASSICSLSPATLAVALMSSAFYDFWRLRMLVFKWFQKRVSWLDVSNFMIRIFDKLSDSGLGVLYLWSFPSAVQNYWWTLAKKWLWSSCGSRGRGATYQPIKWTVRTRRGSEPLVVLLAKMPS